MKNSIFKQIIKYIDEHDILYDYDTYEQMPVFHVLTELECLSDYIKKDYYTSFCVNMAIMYVNQGLLYATSTLSESDFNNFIIYFDLCLNKEDDDVYITVDVIFSRKKDKHISMFKTPIDIKDTKIYEHLKNTVGIGDFLCYYFKNESEEEYYSLVPKSVE